MTEHQRQIQIRDTLICPTSREVKLAGEVIPFTTMEFDVLHFLASNPNIAFTKEQIYEAVSKDNYVESAYVIRDIIYRIRNKTKIRSIQTIHGFGYKFCANDNKF